MQIENVVGTDRCRLVAREMAKNQQCFVRRCKHTLTHFTHKKHPQPEKVKSGQVPICMATRKGTQHSFMRFFLVARATVSAERCCGLLR